MIGSKKQEYIKSSKTSAIEGTKQSNIDAEHSAESGQEIETVPVVFPDQLKGSDQEHKPKQKKWVLGKLSIEVRDEMFVQKQFYEVKTIL
jgi:hypothetical protein